MMGSAISSRKHSLDRDQLRTIQMPIELSPNVAAGDLDAVHAAGLDVAKVGDFNFL